MTNWHHVFRGSSIRIGLIGSMLIGSLGQPATALQLSGPPVYVIQDRTSIERALGLTNFSSELEGLAMARCASTWTEWESCGIQPEGIRPYPGQGAHWWKFWGHEQISWEEFRIPANSMPQLLTCKRDIPLYMYLSFLHKGQRVELMATGKLTEGKLALSTSPGLIKGALDRVLFSTTPELVDGLKIQVSGRRPIQISSYDNLVRLTGRITVFVENKHPISIQANSLDYPIRSLSGAAALSHSVNADKLFTEALERLGDKFQTLTCEGDLCRASLCGDKLELVRNSAGRLHYSYVKDGKIHWGPPPNACP